MYMFMSGIPTILHYLKSYISSLPGVCSVGCPCEGAVEVYTSGTGGCSCEVAVGVYTTGTRSCSCEVAVG